MYQKNYLKPGNYVKDFEAMYQRFRAELLRLHDRQLKLEADMETTRRQAMERKISDRDLLLAKADFEAASMRLQDEVSAKLKEYQTERDEVRAAFARTVEEKYAATPEKVDLETMRLLDSGILTIEELGKLGEKANPVMRRVIAKHAQDMAEGAASYETDKRAKARSLAAMLTQNTTGSAEIDAFDLLADVADRAMTLGRKKFTGPTMAGNFDYAEGFAFHFDEFLESTLAKLESLGD